jgi:hypothetical protein
MVGKTEDFVEMKKQEKRFDELSDLDKMVIGQAVRIEIPFTDQYNMRRIADLLRGYAELLDLWSRRTDLPPRSVLMHLRGEAKLVNTRIRERGEAKLVNTRIREMTGRKHHKQVDQSH